MNTRALLVVLVVLAVVLTLATSSFLDACRAARKWQVAQADRYGTYERLRQLHPQHYR